MGSNVNQKLITEGHNKVGGLKRIPKLVGIPHLLCCLQPRVFWSSRSSCFSKK